MLIRGIFTKGLLINEFVIKSFGFASTKLSIDDLRTNY